MAEGEHLLSAAPRLWQQMRAEFDEPKEEAPSEDTSAEDLKKVGKWLQQCITKFGATAAVAEGEEITKGLKPIAEEVIKSYTAALGTLLSLKRGAGVSLLAELRTAGSDLASALDELGRAVGTAGMAVCAGKVLERVKRLERTSTHSRAAIMRRLLAQLSQMRDAAREMQEALAPKAGGGDEDDDDFFEGFDDDDEELDPSERQLMEALAGLAGACVDVVKKASTACVPPKAPEAASVSVADLEASIVHATAAASAVDDFAVATTGGFDAKECTKAMTEMRGAVTGLVACPACGDGAALKKALASFEAAVAAAEKEDAES